MHSEKTRGILACDIDGTLTDDPFSMSTEIRHVLHSMYESGWKIIFITGRPYVWGVRPLTALDFPYYFAAINGANLIEMPAERLIEERLVLKGPLKVLDDFCRLHHTDYVAYAGYSGGDLVYYRPHRFPPEQRRLLEERAAKVGEKWIAVEEFDSIAAKGFASLKAFGSHTLCTALAAFMEEKLDLHVPVIRDPLAEKNFVAQATERRCTKGEVLKRFSQGYLPSTTIIAAGDDFNDISMFKEADISIVMPTAPEEVKRYADIIAPGPEDGGLASILREYI